MAFHFGLLIAPAARTRPLGAGSIVGGGTVSNHDAAGGHGCIAERRAEELLRGGAAATPYLQHGERIRIEVVAADGQSVFGAIEQQVVVRG